MPAVSKKQQKFFGYLLSNPEERKKKGISKKAAKDFASDVQEVAPPGWGHTKAEKEKTKPWKPKSEIGGSSAAFDRARKEGRFKGSKEDMFKIMWWMYNKGGKPKGKPHYKPGTDEKYKKYQDKDEANEERQITPMQDNNLFGNAYAGTKPPKKKKKLKEETDCSCEGCGQDPCKECGESHHNIKESKEPKGYERFMADAQAARDRQAQKIKDRKEKDAQYVETKSKGVRFYDKKGKGRIKSGKKIYDK